MRKLQAGRLNKRITIQIYNTTADGYGGFTMGAVNTEATIWANVKIKESDITDEFGEVTNKVMVEFIIRKNASQYFDNLTDVLVYENDKYRINKTHDLDDDNYTRIVGTKLD